VGRAADFVSNVSTARRLATRTLTQIYAFDVGYAGASISSKLNGRTNKFGWLQVSATTRSTQDGAAINSSSILHESIPQSARDLSIRV
jgi:hypothetical protein